MTLCNHKRCRKTAILGFRPYENGYDVTSKRGKQYRCELHGKPFMSDGQPMHGVYMLDKHSKV